MDFFFRGRFKSHEQAQFSSNCPVCGDCGYTSQTTPSAKCPGIGQTCRVCSRLNHFGKMCKSVGKGHFRQNDDSEKSETLIFSVDSVNGTNNTVQNLLCSPDRDPSDTCYRYWTKSFYSERIAAQQAFQRLSSS